MDDNLQLRAVSVRVLKTDTYAQDDIYAYDATKMLAKRGTYLDNEAIRRIKTLNQDNDIIYTVSMESVREPPFPVNPMQTELEQKIGYTDVTHETVGLLSEISKNKTVEHNALRTLSYELSGRLDSSSPATILSLVNALAPVDEYLKRHCVNTSLLNGLQGRWLGLDKEAVDRLVLIGLLHDCGKALMPPSILNAKRRLTVAEYEVIKTHPIYSYNLLTAFPEPIRLAARSHHEKINGTGYPDGLRFGQIPMESRITSVSDIYDAMVARRAYKEPQSPFSVMALLVKLGGIELDRKLVSLFVKHMPSELLGKQVILSDGTIADVHFIDTNDIEFPVVNISGRLLKTSRELYCISMF